MKKMRSSKSEADVVRNYFAASGNYLPLIICTCYLLLFGCNSTDGNSFGNKQLNKKTQSVEEFVSSLPSHITRLTHFGQRANWSHDGKKILFLEWTYGDVYEVLLETGEFRPVTHHYYHEGYVRVNYLSNGDILLAGAPNFDSDNPAASRHENAELWVLDKNLEHPPVSLEIKASEGPSVFQTKMTIAWTITHENYPDRLAKGVSQIWKASIQYNDGIPELTNKKLMLDNRDLSFEADLKTQDFRPTEEDELILSAYGYHGTEVMGLDLINGNITNYSQHPGYEEPEGIFPDGEYTTVESDRHTDGKGPIY